MNELPSKQRSSTPWPLLFLLILALAAGGFALFNTMDDQPPWLAALLGTQQAKGPAADGEQAPRVQLPVTGRINDQTAAQASDQAAGQASDQAAGQTGPGLVLPSLPPPAPSAAELPGTAGNALPPADQAENASPAAAPVTEAAPQAEAAQQAETTPEAAGAENSAPEQVAVGGQEAAGGQEPAVNATPARGEAAALSGPDEATGNETPDTVILYGKARPVTRSGSVVRGSIPEGQKAAARTPGAAAPGGDSVVTPAFADDLARFLADNYWPQGTHTLARSRGISTAGVKWANLRYGGQLKGFSGDKSRPERLRERVLVYAFMPSMIQGLYGLYRDYFFAALEEQALARADGPQGAYFTNAQVADMFALYAGMAKDLAGCVQAYRSVPGMRNQVASYADAYTGADSAFKRYMESMRTDGADKDDLADRYYEAVRRRENSHRGLARALRSGSGARLDDDSLVYTALWLYRRGPDNGAALSALEDVCRDSALRLESLEARYRQQPPRQIARHPD